MWFQKLRLRGYGLVVLAASAWGFLGLFYHQLIGVYGLPPLTAAFYRAALPAVLILGWLWLRRDGDRHLAWRDVRFFGAFGLLGVAAMFYSYGVAVNTVGVGVAAVLLYTAPLWVTVFSALFLGEGWSRPKVLALALVVTGVALIAQVYQPDRLQFNAAGLVMGLASGLAYAVYTLFSKVGGQRYATLPMLGYTLAFAALLMLPPQLPTVLDAARAALVQPGLLLALLGMGLASTLLPAWAFVQAMRLLPASNASIVATLEPVVALLLGALLLGEVIEVPQVLGAALILAAVVLLNLTGRGKGAADRQAG